MGNKDRPVFFASAAFLACFGTILSVTVLVGSLTGKGRDLVDYFDGNYWVAIFAFGFATLGFFVVFLFPKKPVMLLFALLFLLVLPIPAIHLGLGYHFSAILKKMFFASQVSGVLFIALAAVRIRKLKS